MDISAKAIADAGKAKTSCAVAPVYARKQLQPQSPGERSTKQLWQQRQFRRRHDERATLGRVLFYERQLSREGDRSCASCHRQERAFSDGLPRSRGRGGRRTARNAMALVNIAYHDGGYFWDGRTRRLEDMVLEPIASHVEMGLDLDDRSPLCT